MSSVWEDPRRVLARYGLAPKRGFSQNFLISERAIAAIVKACELGPDSRVVELGAGCGTLTQALAALTPHVFAVERDPDMLNVLHAECDQSRVQIVAGDAKAVDFTQFRDPSGTRVHVTGNLPYAITGAILRNLVEQCGAIASAVVMVQREVRDRLIAPAGTAEYGALTVFTSQVFQISTVIQLPKTAFHPAPKVTSSVVKLAPLATPRAQPSAAFDTVVRAAFQARRKTLRRALAQALGAERATQALDAAAIDGQRRGETLSVEEFGSLAQAVAAQPSAAN